MFWLLNAFWYVRRVKRIAEQQILEIMVSFHPSLRLQAPKVIQLLLLVGLLLYLGVMFLQEAITSSLLIVCGFWIVFFSGLAILSLYRLRNIEVSLDEQDFYARIGKESIRIKWQDILFVRLVGNFLELATNTNRYVISLNYLDTESIWTQIRKDAPESAFRKDAYLHVPTFQETIADYEILLQDDKICFHAGYSRSAKLGYWLLFLGILLPSVMLLSDNNIWLFSTICFIPFTLLTGALALRSIQTLQVTAQKVIVSNGFKKSELHWHQIERIKAELLYERFIFYGDSKRLVAPGLKVWGQDNEMLVKMIYAQIWKHQIEIEDQNHRQLSFLLNSLPVS